MPPGLPAPDGTAPDWVGGPQQPPFTAMLHVKVGAQNEDVPTSVHSDTETDWGPEAHVEPGTENSPGVPSAGVCEEPVTEPVPLKV